jgi:hypothetical protein
VKVGEVRLPGHRVQAAGDSAGDEGEGVDGRGPGGALRFERREASPPSPAAADCFFFKFFFGNMSL